MNCIIHDIFLCLDVDMEERAKEWKEKEQFTTATSNKQHRFPVRMQLHLTSNPLSVEMGIPHPM